MSDFQQPPPVNPYDSPESVRPGMSSGAKVLLGLGIGCGVLVLLCCGGVGVFVFYFGRSVQKAASEDPATIRRVTHSIVSIDVPESLEPKFSLDWSIPFVNQSIWAAVYADAKDHSSLVLFQVDENLGNAEAMKHQFQQSLRDAGREEWKEVELDESESFETEINGNQAEFKVGSGSREHPEAKVWQATGAFDGKGGPAMLFMQLGADDFDKDQVMAILKSMK
jgi:hypothetical protein